MILLKVLKLLKRSLFHSGFVILVKSFLEDYKIRLEHKLHEKEEKTAPEVMLFCLKLFFHLCFHFLYMCAIRGLSFYYNCTITVQS